MAQPAEVRLAISNICWPDGQAAHDEAVETLIVRDVSAIDIAPTKVWPKIVDQGAEAVTDEDIVDFKRTLRGLDITGFQALTFGLNDYNILGEKDDVEVLSHRMIGLINLAHWVGARTIIFGGPKSRAIPEGMSKAEVRARAEGFFGPLAARAADRGVVLGIEPVSPMYVSPGFGQSGSDVLNFIEHMQDGGAESWPSLVPDSFAFQDNGDLAFSTVLAADGIGALAPHWQISEKGMGWVGGVEDSEAGHDDFAKALRFVASGDLFVATGHDKITLAVEMNPPKDVSVTDALSKTIKFVRQNYPAVN